MARFCQACGAALRLQRPEPPPANQANKANQLPNQPSNQPQDSKIFIAPDKPALAPPPTPETLFPPKSERQPTPKVEERRQATQQLSSPKPDAPGRELAEKLPDQARRRVERSNAQTIIQASPPPPTAPPDPVKRDVESDVERDRVARDRIEKDRARNSEPTIIQRSPNQMSQGNQTPKGNGAYPAGEQNPGPRRETPGTTGPSLPRTDALAPKPLRNQAGPSQTSASMVGVEQSRRPSDVRPIPPSDETDSDDDMLGAPALITTGSGRSLILAGFGLRSAAFMIDAVLTLVLLEIAVYLVGASGHRTLNASISTMVLLFVVVLFIDALLLPVLWGQTFGMKVLGLRIIRIDGRPLGFVGAITRHLVGYPISFLPFMLGFLWVLWDVKQQGWHDKISKSLVVKLYE